MFSYFQFIFYRYCFDGKCYLAVNEIKKEGFPPSFYHLFTGL